MPTQHETPRLDVFVDPPQRFPLTLPPTRIFTDTTVLESRLARIEELLQELLRARERVPFTLGGETYRVVVLKREG